ncbi:cation-translocating P-type ATPase [Nocardioides luteus]|uniref:cation-translocating P-type ATPase n=1 Tax=Nocardioides luteus TaxID=1844 RepID=UPI0018CA89DC|nr:cation-transporting P-type ATPase [Nocardioides luteus]MBG6096995.1 Ca2+-transporting ATPase [Nocardioides luteus]
MPSRTDLESGGLTTAEAALRLEQDGPNAVPAPPPTTLAARVLTQLRDPMILLLGAAFVVVLGLGDVPDASIIAVVVLVNTAIGVVQERRAEQAMAALGRMAAPRARVLRDGRVSDIEAAELVKGDVVRLEAGDVVPADLVAEEAVGLGVDESSMTGESVPVRRVTGEELLSGTVVTKGRGWGVVERIGSESGLGRIAALIATTRTEPTPLQARLRRLSRQLVVATAAIALLVLVLSVLRGVSFGEALILAVSLAVAAIPESLPAVVSVALALGAHRMAKQSAIVRWLPAVETLGSVTVLASDKTGTLTEGRMSVQRIWTPEAVDEAALLRDVVLCNDARLTGPATDRTLIGEPMEAALLLAAADRQVETAELRRRWTRVDEVPFESETRHMVTVDRAADGTVLEVVKGAPEVVLSMLPEGLERSRGAAVAEDLAGAGFRVLAVAHRSWRPPSEPPESLLLVGLVGITDPPRTDAAAVVADCRDAGIRTVLITGDHPATAGAVARDVGILAVGEVTHDDVMDGAAVDRGEHREAVDRVHVYARTRPEQKVDILDALKARGHVVAMTGDGVNDGPALRRADIGVAMGKRGTEVARQAADVVLADDNLRTLVVAVGEGRRVYANIRTFLRYGLAGGLAEVLVILLGPFLGLAFPLGAGQILWINMLTHGVPGVAFGGEPLDRQDMRRPSPSPQRSVLGGGLARQIVTSGLLIAVVSLVAGLLAQRLGWHVQSAVFLTLGAAQLGLAIALRAPRKGWTLAGRGIEVAVLIALLLQLSAVWFGPLRALLGTEVLEPRAQLTLLALACLPGLVVAAGRVAGRLARRRHEG